MILRTVRAAAIGVLAAAPPEQSPAAQSAAASLPEPLERYLVAEVHPAAAERAAVLRDHAERAGMVAALGDLDVGEMPRRR